MNANLLCLSIFNIFVNSFLSFFTAYILIEIFIRLFRISHSRYLSFLKLIPFLKICFDFFFIDWSNWAIAHQIYPWNCPEGTRMLTVAFGCIHRWTDLAYIPFSLKMGFHMTDGYSFSLADVLGHVLKGWLPFVVGVLMIITVTKIILSLAQLFSNFKKRQDLLSECYPCTQIITNKELVNGLRNKKISLLLHPHFNGSPFIIGGLYPSIIFPTCIISHLTQVEYEAIIAHELEHARKYDSLIRVFIRFIAHVFWWIPTSGIVKSIEEKQEMACDAASSKYFDSTAIASALFKVAKHLQNKPAAGIALLQRNSTARRITQVMGQYPIRHGLGQKFIFSITAFLTIFILFGKLWWI